MLERIYRRAGDAKLELCHADDTNLKPRHESRLLQRSLRFSRILSPALFAGLRRRDGRRPSCLTNSSKSSTQYVLPCR